VGVSSIAPVRQHTDPSAAAAERDDPWVLPALLAIVVAGFVLRVLLVRDSVFGDELFTYAIATEDSLGGVFDGINTTENTPPLYYLLAWLSTKLGDPTHTIRLPSLILGTAAIPLVYAIGKAVRSARAGLLAAVVVALSPFAVFYASEARAYAVLGTCVALSTWALLKAVRSESRRWWVVFAVATVAGFYLHYIAIFSTAAQLGWVLVAYPTARRRALIAAGASALAYVPWLPWFGQNADLDVIGQSYPLTFGSVFERLRDVFPGHPFVGPSDVPGTLGLIAFGSLAVVLVAGGAVAWSKREESTDDAGRRGVILLALMLVATPLGLIAYSLVSDTSLYLARNLLPALIPFSVLLGIAIDWLPRPARLAATAALALGLAAGVATLLDADNRRPPLREVAEAIDDQAGPADRVVDVPLFLSSAEPLRKTLQVHLDEKHPTFGLTGIRRFPGGAEALTDAAAWATDGPSARVFVMGYEQPGQYLLPRPPKGSPYRVESRTVYRGWVPLTLTVYSRAPNP
jgi:4-amino-4-deoxy-L-arabinose transferase-like glycosyltransferase